MKDALFCSCCGKLLRVYGDVYCFYSVRWFEKSFVTVCIDCEELLPAETENDKPEHWKIYDDKEEYETDID